MVNNMKKVGIITHYYNSSNYGGLLQSYALCYVLNERQLICEQICYDSSIAKRSFLRSFLHLFKAILTILFNLFRISRIQKVNKRVNQCKEFRSSIPHSNEIYSYKNIFESDNKYDAFIVGSDQVWNPSVFSIGYSLGFTNKSRYSYAASLACDSLTDNQYLIYKERLSNYRKVSVRERQAQNLLKNIIDSKLVLDPVFLLSKEKWQDLEVECPIKEPYCLCYFLGNDEKMKEHLILKARELNLKLVMIDGLSYKRSRANKKFDYLITEVSPNIFLTLIHNAEFVFTDSFHAICFSFIYQKSFYVFNRLGGVFMNSRIFDILETLDCKDRYITQLSELEAIDYSRKYETYEKLLIESNNFIDDVVEEINNE